MPKTTANRDIKTTSFNFHDFSMLQPSMRRTVDAHRYRHHQMAMFIGTGVGEGLFVKSEDIMDVAVNAAGVMHGIVEDALFFGTVDFLVDDCHVIRIVHRI